MSYRRLRRTSDVFRQRKPISTEKVHCDKGHDAIVTTYDDGRKGIRCPGICVICPYGDFLE